MPKHSSKPKNAERATKKQKTDSAPKLSASRVKGSPRPQIKPKNGQDDPQAILTSNGKGKEKATPEPALAQFPRKPKTDAASEETALPFSFKVIAGSYEKLLYGLEGTVTLENLELKYHLKPIFIFPAHVSCIKAVAASPNGGKWLATGSADEIIKVWDLRRRKEIGGLMHHEGTFRISLPQQFNKCIPGSITHLTFPSRSHLLSASEDGTLCLFRARDWAVLRSLKGHKGRVNSVAVHPSGKVALSVGKDKAIRMWDLMRGKGCASTKLGKGMSWALSFSTIPHRVPEAEIVRWSTDGSLFMVQAGSTIDIYNTVSALTN